MTCKTSKSSMIDMKNDTTTIHNEESGEFYEK